MTEFQALGVMAAGFTLLLLQIIHVLWTKHLRHHWHVWRRERTIAKKQAAFHDKFVHDVDEVRAS